MKRFSSAKELVVFWWEDIALIFQLLDIYSMVVSVIELTGHDLSSVVIAVQRHII